jgi:hypothetical protein
MELLERGHFFQCLVENGFVCTPSLFFQTNGVAGFGGLNLVFLVMLSELTVSLYLLFSDRILAQYLCTLFL